MTDAPHRRLDSSSPCKGEDRWGSRVSRFTRTPEATKRARRLRRDGSNAEKKLWYFLQRGQMDGFSFRRQHPISQYVVDFYCAPLKLAIEVDGGQHNDPRHLAHDRQRTRWLQSKGIKVIRFWNNEILENMEGVWEVIANEIASRGKRSPTPTLTLPLLGGGKTPAEVDR